MPRLSDRYYSGREVQRKLNISEPALRNLVNQKKIKKITPPGRQYGVYLKEEVDTYAEKWLAFLTAKEPPKTIFEIAKAEDMDGVYKLAQRAIAPKTMDADLRRSWLEKAPESTYVVKHDEKVVAFVHLLPVEHKTLMDFMEGKIRGWEVTSRDVETFEQEKSVECLAIIASEPDVSETTRMHYVTVLLRGLKMQLRELGKKGYIITKIYATSETPTGIAMAIHIGMQAYGAKIGKRLTFVWDIEKSHSFLTDAYKEGLNEWKKTNQKQSKVNNKRSASPKNERVSI